MKMTEVVLFPHGISNGLIVKNIGWASFLANFSQTHLVTLMI
jgi:hypothetical protein